MKWYNFETMFRSVKEALSNYLKSNGYKYELSGCIGFWHFEILTDPAGAKELNKYIEQLSDF